MSTVLKDTPQALPIGPQRLMAAGWIWLYQPDAASLQKLAAELDVDEDFLFDILDPDENPRLQREDDHLLGILPVPVRRDDDDGWLLRPLGFVLQGETLVTISTVQWTFLHELFATAGKDTASAGAQRRNLLRIVQAITEIYEQALDDLVQRMVRLEELLDSTQSNDDMFRLLEVGKAALQMHAALAGNVAVVFKLSRHRQLAWEKDEKRRLNLLVADLQAVHERAEVLSRTMNSTMDAYGGMVQNNINHGLKVLTTLALVLYIPALLATLYGVNPPIPLQDKPWIFWVIVIGSFSLSGLMAAVFRYRLRWI
ncbi:magnesium transporter CorA family protein [Acidithiobacillus sp.]|uniref:magnesium transporter CorA family protein n=1 Tax=Acidithiobacillus sp. TaxID=1872118 RepID=UPI0025BA1FBA|nr:magnesium transporter CorA family protein [Acidithiobacillus sp.]